LPPPPKAAVDALDKARHKSASVGAWLVALDKHYRKLKACR